jgi:hypothetical protein
MKVLVVSEGKWCNNYEIKDLKEAIADVLSSYRIEPVLARLINMLFEKGILNLQEVHTILGNRFIIELREPTQDELDTREGNYDDDGEDDT